MALTTAQADRIEVLAAKYDGAGSPLSFVDWMQSQGEGVLLQELEAELTAAGDTETLEAIRVTPEQAAEQAVAAITPESLWQSYVDRIDAPTTGGPWALNKSGKWFEVTVQAPGAKVGTYDGRSIYIPPTHPSLNDPDEAIQQGKTPRELRWTDQKFRMAVASMLNDDPKQGLFDLFFRVAPRGGYISSGLSFYDEGIHYASEGGERWPELEPTDPIAGELAAWWMNHDFGKLYAGYGNGNPLNWLRVYTDAEGYRRYKPWSYLDLVEFYRRWMLGIPNVICSQREIENYVADTIAEQHKRQGYQTAQGLHDYTSFWVWPIAPLLLCDAPTERKHKEVLQKLAKAAAVAGVIWLAIYFGPAIAGKMKGFFAKIGPKLKALGKSAGSRVIDSAKDGEVKISDVLGAPETQDAIRRGELPPPPTSTADPSWGDYATVLAQWYMGRELEQQRSAVTDQATRAQIAESDARLVAESEALIRAEVARATREAERVAAGAASDDEAADSFLRDGDNLKWVMLGAAGIAAAAALIGGQSHAR